MEKGVGFNAQWLLEETVEALRGMGYDPQPTKPTDLYAVLTIQLANRETEVWVPKDKGRGMLVRQTLTMLEREFKALQEIEERFPVTGHTRDLHTPLLKALMAVRRKDRDNQRKYKNLCSTSNMLECFPVVRRGHTYENRGYVITNAPGVSRAHCEIDTDGNTTFSIYGLEPEKTKALLQILYGADCQKAWPEEAAIRLL
jgi:hypothetical protein